MPRDSQELPRSLLLELFISFLAFELRHFFSKIAERNLSATQPFLASFYSFGGEVEGCVTTLKTVE